LGIDDLYTYNRDIIYVRSGIYREQVEIDKSITLMGENQETTIIDGERWIDYCIDITEDNVSVEGFTITRANLAGIRIRSENNQVNGHCRIYRNKIIDNNDGIDIIGNYGEPDYNTIARNILKDNHGDGISVYLSDHNTISENSIYGEYWVNICLSSSNYNTIRSNRINHSSIGIDLYSSCNNNRIYFNDITNNTNLGMRICSYGSSYHNIIYWNNFFDNYQNHNAQDDNSGINHWYLVDDSDSPIGRNGNYWEGWNGHGSYPIPGQGHREDRYPFSERDGWSHTHGGKEKCQQALGPWDPPGGN
jgi:parallel beta-helix repeat protein